MTSTVMSEAENTVPKRPTKEIPMVKDQGTFQHTTGDTYDGFFEAKKKDLSVKMNGPGVYKTSEGDTYTGVWDNDKLTGTDVDKVNIVYADGATYEGPFANWSYNGHAKYKYPDGALLECDFVENCPVAKLNLVDPNNQTWLGTASQGYAWFEPVNHFYMMLDKTSPVKGKRNIRPEANL